MPFPRQRVTLLKQGKRAGTPRSASVTSEAADVLGGYFCAGDHARQQSSQRLFRVTSGQPAAGEVAKNRSGTVAVLDGGCNTLAIGVHRPDDADTDDRRSRFTSRSLRNSQAEDNQGEDGQQDLPHAHDAPRPT